MLKLFLTVIDVGNAVDLNLCNTRVKESVKYYLEEVQPEDMIEAYSEVQHLYDRYIGEFVREVAGGNGMLEIQDTHRVTHMPRSFARNWMNQRVTKGVREYFGRGFEEEILANN